MNQDIINQIKKEAKEKGFFFTESKLKRLLKRPKHYFYIKILRPLIGKIGLYNKKQIIKTDLFFNEEIWGYFWDLDFLPLYLLGNLGKKEFSLVFFLCKNLTKKDIFFDIGANYGFYSLLAKQVLKEKNIHLFEPNPDVYKALKLTFQSTKANLNKLALSDKNGTNHFYNNFKELHSGGSSLIKNQVKGGVKENKVKCSKLDSYCKKNKVKPDFIKIDIEGGEYRVLLGGKKTLKRHSPIIAIEMKNNNIYKKASKLLKDLYYRPYKINKKGELIKINEINFNQIDVFENFVFKKV